MSIYQKTDNLFLIDLDQQLEGFHKFISCWIYTKNDIIIIIDPGPASTIPVLVKALQKLHIHTIDYILLTHIHIDHAGGAGALLPKYPAARVICHPKAIPHMVNPEKLWQGSLEVLGSVAEAYQPIVPIAETKMSFQSKIIVEDKLIIDVIETPGHAAHHMNFLIDGFLFAGEVAGVNFPLKNDFYLRIATPPRFIYDVYKNSLYKAAQLECDAICFGHYDMRSDVSRVFDAAKEQLHLWIETIRASYKRNNNVQPVEIFEDLLSTDRCMTTFKTLEPDIQKREQYFALNSIKGMLEYVKQL